MYIIKTDYRSRILTELLNAILTRIIDEEQGIDEVEILADVSKTSEDIIAGYAGKLYDIVPEFSKTAGNRNYQILNWAINIALYLLYQRIEDYDVPQKVIKNYDDTIKKKKKLSTGKFNINIPPYIHECESEECADENNTLRRIGTAKMRSHTI